MAGENVKAFQCPSCGAPVTIRAVGHTVSVVCQSCKAIIDTTNENYKVISKVAAATLVVPFIPLGQKGKIKGETFQVIGFMQRKPSLSVYSWREYLLFNPFKGFRFLTEADGHWNYVSMVKDQPERRSESEVKYLGERYKLFERGDGVVEYVIGEFYWRVQVGEKVQIDDYICPPHILSLENSPGESNWSLGEYIEPDAVKAAFQIEGEFPVRVGVAPDQEWSMGQKKTEIGKYAWKFFAVMVLIQAKSCLFAPNHKVFQESYKYVAFQSEKEREKLGPSFELKGGKDNVQVSFSSTVSNDWLELEGVLVNDATGEEYEFNLGNEYYWGSDSDGSWTEGSRNSDFLISAVPAGNYHLNFQVVGATDDLTPLVSDVVVVTPPNAQFMSDYYPSGKLKSVQPRVNGSIEGFSKLYYESGVLRAEIPYYNGLREGKYKVYREDGTVQAEESYVHGSLEGTQTLFKSDGSIDSTKMYHRGIQLESKSDQVSYFVEVRRGVTIWSNFFFAFWILFLIPIFLWLRGRSYEKSRWSNSDFSPYASSGSSND